MRRLMMLGLLAVVVTACGSPSASSPTSTPAPPTSTIAPAPSPTSAPTGRPSATATPVVIGKRYAGFVRTLCAAFRRRDARAIANSLPYYQYNSGLRYGYLGDGEGQTGDPSLLGTWLAHSQVRCMYFTPDVAGHGVVLTRGWPLPGGSWSLIEMDTFNGRWKINDFTFGRFPNLFWAMHAAQPILRYG